MKGILVLAHGSRKNNTIDTMNEILTMIKEKNKDVYIENAYMELATPLLPDSLEKMVNNGIDDIVIIPYFLFEGLHIQSDIPEEIEQFCAQYPNVKVKLGNTLGADPRLADILCERIASELC